jgi:two-component system, response regulator / RNA-binding antiterminator
MLKILLVDDTPDRASPLKSAFSVMEGVEVASTPSQHPPDIVVIDTRSPSRDVLEQFAASSSSAPSPVVLFTEDALSALRTELEDTKAQLADRKLIDRAKGILMKHRGLDEDAAYVALRSLAMERGLRMGEAARQVIDVAGLLG